MSQIALNLGMTGSLGVASAYALGASPSSVATGSAATVTVTPNGTFTGTITVTPSGGGLGTPLVFTFSGTSTAQSQTLTPTSAGAVTLVGTNSAALTNPSNAAFTAFVAATTYTLSPAPSSITVGSAITVTLTPDGVFTGTITVTPTGSAATGLSAQAAIFSGSATPQTVSFTPTASGTLTLTGSDNGGLADPSAATVAVSASSSGGSGLTDDQIATLLDAANRIVAMSEADPFNAGSYRLTAASLMNLGGGFLVTASSANSVSFVGPGDVADHAYERKMLYPAQTEESGLIASHTKQGSGPTAVHTVALDPDADSTLSVAPPVGSFVNISVDRAS